MHLTHRIATIVLTLGLSASLASCGFHLRGTQIATLPADYRSIQLSVSEAAQDLQKPLTIYLSNLGAKVDQPDANVVLRIQDYRSQRQLFSGKLTEVQLRISATFVLENIQGEQLTEPRTVITQRNYQYDIASVNTERQEEAYLIRVMQDDIAQQIIRQIHAGRLPSVKIDHAP